MSGERLVLDWDGTVTESDALVMVLREFGDPDVFESAAAAVERGEISINEELRRQFAAVTASLDDVVAWLLPRVRVRTGFHELVERFRPLVITSGFHELVDPVLAREGLRRVVYVGDGFSDRCAARAAHRVFARDGLARYLAARAVAFEPFEDFHAVLAALDPV